MSELKVSEYTPERMAEMAEMAEDMEVVLAYVGATVEAIKDAIELTWRLPSRRLKLLLKRQAANYRRSVNGRSRERHLR